MKRFPALLLLLGCSVALFAATSGAWLRRVPDEDHLRHDPYRGQPAAITAGRQLFQHNCTPCHGFDAMGRLGRPSLRSLRVRHATDGDLAWMLQHGNPYKGMPPWSSLPETERWQIIAYLRTLPPIGKPMPR